MLVFETSVIHLKKLWRLRCKCAGIWHAWLACRYPCVFAKRERRKRNNFFRWITETSNPTI